ncbi:DsbA family protein [Marinobacter sp. LV10R510-11A]|uniref:DsbA family oxidoreductase n=1 Tax=Marinobacter sp. LV10R510-11A TaxID=1415568 RepID=UPI000BB877C1|nr:DsbA family protein [Marinobacter sp. LV10R510-11A]
MRANQGQQAGMNQALFEAYFGRAEDVSDHNILIRCVEALGLDPAKAREVLESDQYARMVREDEATYQKAGITSVPAFKTRQVGAFSETPYAGRGVDLDFSLK